MNEADQKVVEEVLAVSRKLLACIDAGNWAEYVKLCDESITCFEPEALGHTWKTISADAPSARSTTSGA